MELTPALASHLTKAQSHLTHLPGLYELYRTCFASTCETTAKLLAGGKHLFSRETSPPCGCVTPARKCATIFPLRGRIRSCKPCWKGSFRGRRNISVSTPMPTPLMKIRQQPLG